MSQEELAEKCELHPTYIGQLERGEKNATLESIEKVANGLSISLSRLFENIEEIHAEQINYPMEAYRLVQEFSQAEQAILLDFLKGAVKFKNTN